MTRTSSPRIGLVAKAGSVAKSLRRVLEKNGYPLAFDVEASELPPRRGTSADLVIVVGDLEPREDALFLRVRDMVDGAPIVAVAGAAKSPALRWAMEQGLEAVVWADDLEKTLEPSLRAVAAGQIVFPPALRRVQRDPGLTNREKQVLSLVVMGLTNREIADKLFIGESTVKTHLHTAFRKIGVTSRAEASKLITDPEEGLGPGILAITGTGLYRGANVRRLSLTPKRG